LGPIFSASGRFMENRKALRLSGNWLRAALFLGLLGIAVASGAAASAQTLVLRGGSVYASPDAVLLADAVVVVSGGAISAVGRASDVQVPPDARVIDCTGKTIVAGFWNSHVHFTEAVWKSAADGPAAPLTAHMQEMLTRWGFTTVWDLGSNPAETLPLRRRVNAGDVAGPNILLAGNMYPKGGHPIYVPREVQVPEVATPDEAAKQAREFLAMGHDGIKLFTGSFMGDKPVVNMDTAVAKAAVDVAHAQGKPIFAHPQNRTGVETVIAAGVDVMAHPAPAPELTQYTSEQLARFKSQGTALIPTLSLYTTVVLDPGVTARIIAVAVNQLRQFAENGGVVLFGTDIGFIKIYDTTLEYDLMHRALSERQVLASLTTNPAQYFKAAKKGRVERGFDGDLVVLDGDPMTDVRNLAKVAYTIRAGQIIYQKP
jgi:imidazolonepropionase-like amidohydrolase